MIVSRTILPVVLAAIFCSCLPAGTALAQEAGASKTAAERSVALKVNTLPLLMRSVNVFAEGRLSDRSTLSAGVNYFDTPPGEGFFNFHDRRYLGITTEYKRYFIGQALTGFYASPYLKYRHVRERNVPHLQLDAQGNPAPDGLQDQTWHQMGVGATLGGQYVFDWGLTLELFAGGGYYFISEVTALQPGFINRSKPVSIFDIRLGTMVGFAF